MNDQNIAPPELQLSARALIVGERVSTSGLERPDLFTTAPLSFRVGDRGLAAIFRYGVVVFIGLTPLQEDEILRALEPRISKSIGPIAEDPARLRVAKESANEIAADGAILLKEASPAHFLVVADILAKSAALDQAEKEISSVLDRIEPWAAHLAETGRARGGRREMLMLAGAAIRASHRATGRVAAREKPDILWDRPDLERLYARLADEYEIEERADAVDAKLAVIGDASGSITDLIDADRSERLELVIIALIAVEILFTIYDFWLR
jgi:uncharacterized Rmd1/YagE family protein